MFGFVYIYEVIRKVLSGSMTKETRCKMNGPYNLIF